MLLASIMRVRTFMVVELTIRVPVKCEALEGKVQLLVGEGRNESY